MPLEQPKTDTKVKINTELSERATDVLGVTFEQSFALPDGTQLKIESRMDDRDGK